MSAETTRCPECWGENGEHLFNCSRFYDQRPSEDACPYCGKPRSEHPCLAGTPSEDTE